MEMVYGRLWQVGHESISLDHGRRVTGPHTSTLCLYGPRILRRCTASTKDVCKAYSCPKRSFQEIGAPADAGRGGARTAGDAGRLGDDDGDVADDSDGDGNGDDDDDDDGDGHDSASQGGLDADHGTALAPVGMSDLDYLRSKVVSRKWSDSEDEEDAGGRDTWAGGNARVRGDQAGVGPSTESAEAPRRAKLPRRATPPGSPRGGHRDAGDASDEEAGAGAGIDSAAAPEAAAAPDVEEVAAGAVEEASIAETGRLFVRNLAYTASEADLAELFAGYGDLSEVHLVLDR